MSRILLVVALIGLAGLAFADHHRQPWLGKWISSTEKLPTNWEAFFLAIDLPVEKFGGNTTWILKLSKEDCHYISDLKVPSANYSTTWSFKLGEEGSHAEFNNAIITYTFTEEGEKLLTTIKLPNNKVVNDVYEVVGDELVKTYKVDAIEGKRWFKREANEVKP